MTMGLMQNVLNISTVAVSFVSENVRVCSVTQSCLILCDSMDCSPPDSSVHGIFQTRILERVAISYSRELPNPRSLVSPALVSEFFTTVTLGKPKKLLSYLEV